MNSALQSALLHSPSHVKGQFQECSRSSARPGAILVRSATQESGEAPPSDVCSTCGINNASKPKGCDGQGRIAGGLGAVVGWFPIKAYRPCPAAVKGNFLYTRKGQITDEVLFGKGKQKR